MRNIILSLLFILTTLTAFAANYFVATTGGNDTNPGTETQPWKTITKAANTLIAGDTVFIKAGNYPERVVPQNSGSANNFIVFTNYQDDIVIIDGASVSWGGGWFGLFDVSYKDYISIVGLQIKNAEYGGIWTDTSNYIIIKDNYTYNTVSCGIGVWNSSNVIVEGNEIELACNTGSQECISVSNSSFCEIFNNNVHHNGDNGDKGGEGIDIKQGSHHINVFKNKVHHLVKRTGIYADAWNKHTHHINIYQNIVHHCSETGISIASESGGVIENINIYNNIIYFNKYGGIELGEWSDIDFPGPKPIKNVKIINNTCYKNGSYDDGWGFGIVVNNPHAQNITIRNNICSENTAQLSIQQLLSDSTVDHNLIHGFNDADGTLNGNDSIIADPLFLNTNINNPNFKLNLNSPAINNGSTVDAPSIDFDDNNRSAIDIGAYEFQGNTYYVDMSQGNDNWDGTSPTTAFKTINKVNQLTLFAGDSILFKRGEIWNGTRLFIEEIHGTSNSNIIYAAYDSGNKPIISSVVNQPHSWINTGGNIWKANNPPAEHPERLLINGVEKLRANIQSELDGVTYIWRYDTSTNDLYLYSTIDPNSFTIEYSTDFPIIIGYSSNITLRDIDIQGGWTGIFINTKSKNITLDSMNIGKYCREGVIINSDSSIPSDFPENIIVKNCNFDSYFAFDFSSAGDYDGSFDRGSSDGIRSEAQNNGEIKNCLFKNWGHASISLSGGSNITVANISVHNNYLTSPDICYGGRMNADESKNCEFFYNQIINTSVQSQLNGQNNHYHHNIFRGTTNTPLITTIVDAGIEVQAYDETQIFGNTYEHNLIADTEGPGFRISGNNEQSIHNNIFKNNIIYNCGTTINGVSLVVEENEFEQTIDNSFLSNLVYSPTTNQTIDFRGVVYDVAGFNALTGTDGYVITNNLFGDPLFVDYNNEDYHLQSSSPCIDAGVTSLALLDFGGDTIPYSGTLPDIGIYEYQDILAIEILSPLSAYAKKENIILKWSTVIEKNNKGFELQRSNNAIDWTNIGWIKGNNNEGKSYQYIDKTPEQGINYYRYKQIDFDDKYQYSNVVSVVFRNSTIQLFPNPTSGILNIVSSSNDEIEGVVIYNQLGLKISQNEMHRDKIDVSYLPKGLYFLELKNVSNSDKYWFIKLE